MKPQQVTLVSVHCTLRAHQSPLHKAHRGRGGMLPKNNTKDCQAPPPRNTIAPWFDDPSRRERNFFFFFFKQRISQGGISIQLNMDVWEALNRENPQETGLRLNAITLFCADRLTLFPEKINGYFEQFHTRHLMHTVSSQIWRLQNFTGTKRERERKEK